MDRYIETEKELNRLRVIFKNIEAESFDLIQGLLEETAYLKVELNYMRGVLNQTGMLKINPKDFMMQKVLPIANEYRRTINIYALNIKVLNGILLKGTIEEDDEFDEWIKANKTRSTVLEENSV